MTTARTHNPTAVRRRRIKLYVIYIIYTLYLYGSKSNIGKEKKQEKKCL